MGVFFLLCRGTKITAAAAKKLFFLTRQCSRVNRIDPASVPWVAESAELRSRLGAANTPSHVT